MVVLTAHMQSRVSQEDNTYTLGTTLTVEDFWSLYVHLRRPVDERPTVCDYHVFREGIRPMWEDEANVNGGKWIVRLKKGLAARYWEDVVRLACAHTPSPPLRTLSPALAPLPRLPRSCSPSLAGSSASVTRSAAAYCR